MYLRLISFVHADCLRNGVYFPHLKIKCSASSSNPYKGWEAMGLILPQLNWKVNFPGSCTFLENWVTQPKVEIFQWTVFLVASQILQVLSPGWHRPKSQGNSKFEMFSVSLRACFNCHSHSYPGDEFQIQYQSSINNLKHIIYSSKFTFVFCSWIISKQNGLFLNVFVIWILPIVFNCGLIANNFLWLPDHHSSSYVS